MGAAPNPATGEAWDVTSPDNAQPHGNDFNEHHETKLAFAIRINKEHVTIATASAGGEHKSGSAKAYVADFTTTTSGDALPVKRPDAASPWSTGGTALDSADYGRMAWDTDAKGGILHIYDSAGWNSISCPPGIMAPFAGNTTPPGWLLCDGSAVSRTTYARLFQAIGILWGAGDTTTTFNLPDMKQKVPVGKDASQTATPDLDTVGNTGGELNHTLDTTEMPAHIHNVQLAYGAQIEGGAGVAAGGGQTDTSSTGGGLTHNNMPPFGVVNYIIKT